MQNMKVYDTVDDSMPQGVRDTCHSISCEYFGNGNDSYFPFAIGDREENKHRFGELSSVDTEELSDWLINNGAEESDIVLIKNWW